MSILWTIIIGFVAGVIAKFVTPGTNEPSGFILTTILGIIGAFVATWLGQALGWYRPGRGSGPHRCGGGSHHRAGGLGHGERAAEFRPHLVQETARQPDRFDHARRIQRRRIRSKTNLERFSSAQVGLSSLDRTRERGHPCVF